MRTSGGTAPTAKGEAGVGTTDFWPRSFHSVNVKISHSGGHSATAPSAQPHSAAYRAQRLLGGYAASMPAFLTLAPAGGVDFNPPPEVFRR